MQNHALKTLSSVSRNPIVSGTTFATTEQALTSVIVRPAQ